MSPEPDNRPVTRMKAANAAAMLERLQTSDRLERGAVFVLSVEAIKEHSPERWPKRRGDVWDYLKRKLHEHMAYQDLHQQIGDTECLVAMVTEDGVAAQAVGLKVLEEVLRHFLGAAERIDLRIRAVGKIEGDEITVTDLDPDRIAKARKASDGQALRPHVSPELERERNPVSFVAKSGLQLRIDFALENVISLRHGVTAVLRVEPTVSFVATGEVLPARKFSRLSDEDVGKLDRATLAFAALFTPLDARNQPPIIAPVSFRNIASRKGLHSLSVIEGLTPERVRQGMLVELVDVARGTPLGRLVETAGLLNQLTRGVLARVAPGRDALDPIRGVRFNGVTMDFAEMQLADDHLEQLMRLMVMQLRGAAPAIIAQGLPFLRHLQKADTAGFTHAAVRGEPMTAERSVA